MTQTLKLKRSAVSGRAPTTSDLELGELAINTTDGKIYIKKSVSGTESIISFVGSTTTAPVIDTMTGDGSDTTLALSVSPSSENQTFLTIDGVLQHKDTYAISGSTLTFDEAPANTAKVECITFINTTITDFKDGDGDTKIQVEESSDDDTIRFDTAGSERMTINSSGVIQFNGAYTFPTSDGSADQVLKTDGSGALSFGTVSSGSSTSIADADADTKIQVEESSDEDTIRFDTAGSEKMTLGSTGILEIVPNTGVTGIRLKDDGNTNIEMGSEKAMKSGGSAANFAMRNDGGNVHVMTNGQNNRLIVFQNGDVSLGGSTGNIINSSSGTGVYFENGADFIVSRSGGAALSVLRQTNDGELIRFKQAGSQEGSIDVSGSTVSLSGFVGIHESSGVDTSTDKGTVVSSIDELDTYLSGSKIGQDRIDHPKVKISDSVGDTRVLGVLAGLTESDGKLKVAGLGVGSIKVTGACNGGDLLESNGDGTAKVQDDDVIRSKTIGKVTIGNSDVNVKLVSCILYCG